MKTLSQLRSQVRSMLNESTGALDWTDAELDKNINIAFHRVVTSIMTIYEDFYMTSDTFGSVAGQQEYTDTDGLPTDIYKIRRIEVNYKPSSPDAIPVRFKPMTNIDQVNRDLGFKSQAIGVGSFSNGWYYTYGFGEDMVLGLTPKPSETGATAIKIWYIPEQADMTADSDKIKIPYADRYWHLVCEGACGISLRFGQVESTEADKFDIRFEAGIATMLQELKERIAEDFKGIIDVQGDVMGLQESY